MHEMMFMHTEDSFNNLMEESMHFKPLTIWVCTEPVFEGTLTELHLDAQHLADVVLLLFSTSL